MEDLTFTTQSSFLHHGIEGQKWGVQNGPPYPLDRANSKRIVREKRKEYRKAKEAQMFSKPNLIRKIVPLVANLTIFHLDPDEENSYIQAILSALFDTETRETIRESQEAKKILAQLIASVAAVEIVAPLVSEGIIRGTGLKEQEKLYDQYVKESKESYKKAKQYAKLAQNSNLSKEDIIVLNNLKKELNLK